MQEGDGGNTGSPVGGAHAPNRESARTSLGRPGWRRGAVPRKPPGDGKGPQFERDLGDGEDLIRCGDSRRRYMRKRRETRVSGSTRSATRSGEQTCSPLHGRRSAAMAEPAEWTARRSSRSRSGRAAVAGGTGGRAAEEHLPTACGAAGVDSEAQPGKFRRWAYRASGTGSADGGDASGIADLRGGPASGAICLQGRPQRAGRSRSTCIGWCTADIGK